MYETIPLKAYHDIARTGEVVLMQRSGTINLEGCAEAWDELIKRNAEVTKNRRYFQYRDSLKEQGKLMNNYCLVKAMLTKLAYTVDMECVKYLNTAGYRIYIGDITEDKAVREAKYSHSIMAASRKCDNLITKLKMSQNELQEFKSDSAEQSTLGTILANLSYHIGFQLRDDILLSEFNEYSRIAQQKISQLQKMKGHGSRNSA